MRTIREVRRSFHIESMEGLRNMVALSANPLSFARSLVRALLVAGAHLHPVHEEPIQVTLTQVGTMGQQALVELSGRILGSYGLNEFPEGILAVTIPYRHERYNRRIFNAPH